MIMWLRLTSILLNFALSHTKMTKMLTSFHSALRTSVAQADLVPMPKPSKSLAISPLSVRELEVLHLIAYEYSSKEIAQQLYVCVETIHSHRKNIMMKLGVKNTAGMVRVACEQQLLKIA